MCIIIKIVCTEKQHKKPKKIKTFTNKISIITKQKMSKEKYFSKAHIELHQTQ